MIPPCPRCARIPNPSTHFDKDGKPIYLCACKQGSFYGDEKIVELVVKKKKKKRS
jgi:hypothetical protein